MQEPPVTLRSLLLYFTTALFMLSVLFLGYQLSSSTKIVFCDVGQGDATYIRINNQTDVLIDAGADRKVLSCLGKYMPFFDKRLEVAFLTHPQKDHYGGYIYVLDHYNISYFIHSGVGSTNMSYIKLLRKLMDKAIPVKTIYAGDSISVGDASFEIMWPTRNFVRTHSRASKNMLFPLVDPNDFSQVMVFTQSEFRVLFTGDITTSQLNQAVTAPLSSIDILKVPHHGSKNGLNLQFMKLADPEVSVISCGNANAYGHPALSTLEALAASGSKIRRTDVEGSIVFEAK